MIMPSITACGLKRRMSRSWQVPGSDSSELHRMHFVPGALRGMKLHFSPVGKPAPPRPRRADCLTRSITASRVIGSVSTRRSAW